MDFLPPQRRLLSEAEFDMAAHCVIGEHTVGEQNGTSQNGNVKKTVRVTKRYVLQNDTYHTMVCVTERLLNGRVTKRYMSLNGTFH
jgi:hypothetical protein